MRRGRITIVCNLGTEEVSVPATGEFLLGWGERAIGTHTTRLSGHSVVVLRTASSPA